jgi:probable HAF family extracellular repeat protein
MKSRTCQSITPASHFGVLMLAVSLIMAAPANAQQNLRQSTFPLATGGNRITAVPPLSPQPSFRNNEIRNRDVRYNVVPIGVLPDKQNSFLPISGSINDNGVLAGYCYNGSSIFFTSVPFLWENGTFQRLPLLSGWPGAFAFGLNNNKRAFGVANTGNNVFSIVQTPVLWKDGNAINLGIPAGYSTAAALGINNQDAVVGYAFDFKTGTFDGFVWYNGQTTQLPLPADAINGYADGVNDQGEIVGYVDYGDSPPPGTGEFHSVLWTPNGRNYDVVDLGGFGGQGGQAFHITSDGQVVGFSSDAAENPHAYLWTGGPLQDLGTLPGGTFSIATISNLAGQILGEADRADGRQVAFLWQNGVMLDVNELVRRHQCAGRYCIDDDSARRFRNAACFSSDTGSLSAAVCSRRGGTATLVIPLRSGLHPDECRPFLCSYDAPLTLFPSALSGKRTPSKRILRLNFDLPDSRSEKMMGNSPKMVPLRCRVNFISIRKA